MEVVTLEHKDTEQTVAPEEVVSINFMKRAYTVAVYIRDSHQNQMGIYISAMLSPFALTLG